MSLVSYELRKHNFSYWYIPQVAVSITHMGCASINFTAMIKDKDLYH